jgi:hypothetical protein
MAKQGQDVLSLLDKIKEQNDAMREINAKLQGSTTPKERKDLQSAYNFHEYTRETLMEYLVDTAKGL